MQPHFARTRYHRIRSLSAVISPNEEGDRLPGEREDGRKRGLRGHFRGSFHLHGYAERYAKIPINSYHFGEHGCMGLSVSPQHELFPPP